MNIMEALKNIENIINESKSLPGTSKVMVDKEKTIAIIKEVVDNLPNELDEAGMVSRQKEAILDQADKEAARIRNYADEEASTMREIAQRDAAGIIKEAEEKASNMIEETSIVEAANLRAEELISEAQRESERIVVEAQQRSSKLLEESENLAKDRRDGADNYAREILFALEERISTILGQVRSGLDLLDEESENISVEENK